MPTLRTIRSNERGTALIEFALCLSLFWLPLFLGTIEIGFSLRRAIQVTQVCRDISHMYSSGVDFSQASAQNLLQSLAPGIDLTSTSTTAVIILSTITKVNPADCTAANVNPCTNHDQDVITRRIVIGGSSIQTSQFGTPGTSTYQDASGSIKLASYMGDTSTQATGFSSVLPSLAYDQNTWVAEMYVQSPGYAWAPFLGTPSIAARSIF
jgi:Flp pilus assembly protein TadG